MSNTLLTPTMVTDESLRILHQKCNFIGTINKQYDDSYAKKGAKIGDSLKIRLPNQYTVTTGRVMTAQDTTESSVTLQVATQKHVGMNFTYADLTLSIDKFSERYIEPAMNVLAAAIEADGVTMFKDIYQQVNNQGSSATMAKLLAGRKKLVDALAPAGGWVANLDTQTNADLVDALKGLFHDDSEIAEQYREGKMGRTGSFTFYENTQWPSFTTGTENGSSSTLTVNGASQTGATVTIANGSSKTLNKGDIITFAGCNRVHPESKVDTGVLQQFVVTADVASGGTSVAISPSIITSGATQTVAASPTNGGAVTKVGTASQAYGVSMLYHPEAFTFVSADLELPDSGWFARRKLDGISMRIWRDSDIVNDMRPCRIDVLYGFKTIRAALACRFANN